MPAAGDVAALLGAADFWGTASMQGDFSRCANHATIVEVCERHSLHSAEDPYPIGTLAGEPVVAGEHLVGESVPAADMERWFWRYSIW